jgi:glycosyltransferase involved in cell wall biosynthesis
VAPPKVSIVIPCFEEEQTIPRLAAALDGARARLLAEGRGTEAILVDDGSRDGTWAALRAAQAARPWMRLVRFRRNFGQTAAMAAGFSRARGQYIVPMDADLQNDPDDIPALLAKLEEGHDVVSGWRRDRHDRALSRRMPSRIANWIIGRASGVRLHDYGCTLKAYRREYLENVHLYGEMHRFIPIYAKWQGARVTEMVVRHHPRKEGRSKYGIGRTLKVLLDLMTLKLLGDYSTKPLYFFGRAGFVLCFLGFVCGVVTIVEKFTEGAYAHRNPMLLLGVLLFIVGIQLIGMGLLAELQVRTYHESQAKPIYLVAEELELGAEPEAEGHQEVKQACAESPASSPAKREPSTRSRSGA